jgi:O-methyltransferase
MAIEGSAASPLMAAAKSFLRPIIRSSVVRFTVTPIVRLFARALLPEYVVGREIIEKNRPLLNELDSLSREFKSSGLVDLSAAAAAIAQDVSRNPYNVAALCAFAERVRLSGRRDIYRSLVKAVNLQMFSTSRHEYLHDFTDFERETYVEVARMCAQMPESIASTIRFVEYVVANNIPGDFVECGVWLGASPYVIAKTLLRLGESHRRIFMYDTYEGFPSDEPIDIPYSPNDNLFQVLEDDAAYRAAGADVRYSSSDHMRSSMEQTRANVELAGYPSDKLIFVKGLVEDTIPEQIPDQIALLRLDTDLYRSTKHEFDHLYPRLSRGGVLVVDDYGFYLGSKQATDEYFKGHGIPLCLFRIDEHVRATLKF